MIQVSLFMHRVGGTVPPPPPPVVPQPGARTSDGVQIGMSGQETPSESSEGDSSECDTTGDEDGWESGESSASLVMKRHSHTHGSSQNTHSHHAHHRASLRGTAKESSPRADADKRDSQNSNSTASIRRSSGLFRSFTFDT